VIRGLAARGVAVLLVSSEVPEVLGLADRVLVVREGRVIHTAPATALDERDVLNMIMEGRAAVTERSEGTGRHGTPATGPEKEAR
jgi:ribose transport system ATP-binding protein